MEIKEFTINEENARTANELNSFGEYAENSATKDYRAYLARFTFLVNNLKKRAKVKITPEIEEAIQYYANRYSYKLSQAMNKYYAIESMYPSIMISGAGNFNVRKKEKQNRSRETFYEQYGDLYNDDNYYMKKIENLLMNNVIYSNDEFAIEKLNDKISELEESQKLMKDINAYYRKNKTLEGCDLLPEKEIVKIIRHMQMYSYYDIPFAPFELQNNNANIKRLKDRVKEIEALKQRAEQKDAKYIDVEGLEVVEDATDMRIRIIFNDIPDASTRELLKSYGFKWSPKNGAWQRQLTSNGIYSTRLVLERIKEGK